MIISLNGVLWNDSIIWSNEFDFSTVSQTIKRTLTGTQVIHNMSKNKGREIILTASSSGEEFSGYWTKDQIQQVKILESTVIPTTLIYGNQSFTVIVLSGGVSVTPVQTGKDQDSTDLYTGSITFIEV